MTEGPNPPVDHALSWTDLPLDDDIRRLLTAQQRMAIAPADAEPIKQLLVELCRDVVCADGAALEELEGERRVVKHETGDLTGVQAHIVHPLPGARLDATVTVVSKQQDGLTSRDAAVLQPLVALAAARLGRIAAFNKQRALLESQARSDDLTGLANRRVWLERLSLEMARALRTGSPLVLVIFDLDHFKDYNDQYGHQAGDTMLQQTATAWQAQIRETDLLARLGGEEFALLLPDTALDAGALIGQRLLDAVPDGITTSCGLALWRGEDSTQLYRRADEALYAAKAAGRNQLAIAPDHGA